MLSRRSSEGSCYCHDAKICNQTVVGECSLTNCFVTKHWSVETVMLQRLQPDLWLENVHWHTVFFFTKHWSVDTFMLQRFATRLWLENVHWHTVLLQNIGASRLSWCKNLQPDLWLENVHWHTVLLQNIEALRLSCCKGLIL